MKERTLYVDEEFSNQRDYNIHWWNLSYTYYHRHCGFYEFILTNKPLKHIIEGNETIVPEHSLILVSPMTYHKLIDNSKTTDLNHFNLSIKTDYFNMIIGNHILPELFKNDPVPTVHLSNEEYAYFFFLAEKAFFYYNDTALCGKYLSTYITAALSTLEIELFKQRPEKEDSYAEVLRAKLDNFEFLDKQISDFYKLFPVNPAELISDFKQLTGSTIVQYVTQKRILLACNLLSNTHLSLEQITYKIGYNSVSHFIRVFKSVKNMTPSKFRESH